MLRSIHLIHHGQELVPAISFSTSDKMQHSDKTKESRKLQQALELHTKYLERVTILDTTYTICVILN